MLDGYVRHGRMPSQQATDGMRARRPRDDDVDTGWRGGEDTLPGARIAGPEPHVLHRNAGAAQLLGKHAFAVESQHGDIGATRGEAREEQRPLALGASTLEVGSDEERPHRRASAAWR
jgi:hypothetical protein